MMIPIKNDGAEIPMMLEKTAVVSIHVFCFTAAVTPKGIPMSTAMNMAAMASINVHGKASSNTSLTDLFV